MRRFEPSRENEVGGLMNEEVRDWQTPRRRSLTSWTPTGTLKRIDGQELLRGDGE